MKFNNDIIDYCLLHLIKLIEQFGISKRTLSFYKEQLDNLSSIRQLGDLENDILKKIVYGLNNYSNQEKLNILEYRINKFKLFKDMLIEDKYNINIMYNEINRLNNKYYEKEHKYVLRLVKRLFELSSDSSKKANNLKQFLSLYGINNRLYLRTRNTKAVCSCDPYYIEFTISPESNLNDIHKRLVDGWELGYYESKINGCHTIRRWIDIDRNLRDTLYKICSNNR